MIKHVLQIQVRVHNILHSSKESAHEFETNTSLMSAVMLARSNLLGQYICGNNNVRSVPEGVDSDSEGETISDGTEKNTSVKAEDTTEKMSIKKKKKRMGTRDDCSCCRSNYKTKRTCI